MEKSVHSKMKMFHCHVCGSSEARDECVDEVFQIDGKHVLVENIPAKVCVRCGEKSFSPTTAEKIRQLVHGKQGPQRAVPMDVFEYA